MFTAKLLDILSLIISFAGSLAIARGLFISEDDAVALGVSRWCGDDKKQNMKFFDPKEIKKLQQEKAAAKSAKDKSVSRFQQNASRLEHSNVRNKNKGKKG